MKIRELSVVFTLLLIIGCATQTENPSTKILNPKSQVPNKSQAPNFNILNPKLEARIQLLIKQLDDNKPAVREGATNELILIGKPAEPYLQETLIAVKGKNAEVEWRTKIILNAIPIRERIKFSDELLKWYPTIYRELANDDAVKRLRVLRKVTEANENREPLHDATDDDIAGVIGEILLDGGKGLDTAQKVEICIIASNGTIFYDKDGQHGWWNKIPQAIPHIRKLLKDDNTDVRRYVVRALSELLTKDEAVRDIKELLKDEDTDVRRYALIELSRLLTKEESIQSMKELLKDENAEIRGSAGIILVGLGEKDLVPKEIVENIKGVVVVHGLGSDFGYPPAEALRILGVSEEEIEELGGK
ncbi:MAG: hypothetical protein A2W23_05840 [Planctomycetes bacterium RBG_16_43_13]|nr:MAG: hypothetical protein A2W23_05840 [Planctomycetes bacterium RBG_16_43_13]